MVSNWSGELYAVFGGKTKIEASSFKLPSISNPWGVALADLNKDGKSDLIIADGNTKLAAVYISKKEWQSPYNKGFQVGFVTACSVPLRFIF